MVPTGLSVAIPQGYEIQVRPRSGLAAKHGLTCLNTPGTIDSDYRGEIKVILVNLGQEAFTIQRGERDCAACSGAGDPPRLAIGRQPRRYRARGRRFRLNRPLGSGR